MATIEEETEFSRRRGIATEARHMHTKRTHDVSLTYRGMDLGTRTELLSRGKVVSVNIFLPPMPKYP